MEWGGGAGLLAEGIGGKSETIVARVCSEERTCARARNLRVRKMHASMAAAAGRY